MRFAYDNADAYVRWQIHSYIVVEGQDADELDERIDEFHAWHRKNALPKYVTIAHEAAQRFSDGLSHADVVWGYDSARAQARESLRKAAELVAPLLDRLTPEQIAGMERRIAEENRTFYRDNLRGSERDRRARRARNAINRLEDWVGKLTQAQVQRVREYAERAPLTDELRDRDRKRLQKDVVAIVRAQQARSRLPERVANWEKGREPAYLAALEAWREQYFAMLLDVDRMLTPEQRARGLGHMRRYADDFEALAAR
ncbi:MAG TPA: DUF6279 family lipoprotein [Burkholderiales bacterium]|nr:DUF6279 family lipoprotein [Burkholderiales bacterium]